MIEFEWTYKKEGAPDDEVGGAGGTISCDTFEEFASHVLRVIETMRPPADGRYFKKTEAVIVADLKLVPR